MPFEARDVAYVTIMAAFGNLIGMLAVPIGPTTVTFGEISYVLVGMTMGPVMGTIVALFGSLYTFILYGNVFGIVSWVVVAPVFSYLCVHRGVHPLWSMLPSALIAVPVSIWLVPFFLKVPLSVAYLLALKSYLNRVVVAGIVAALVSEPRIRSLVPINRLLSSWIVKRYGLRT